MINAAIIIPDTRDELGFYDRPQPMLGPPIQALAEGFAQLPDCKIHLVSTSRKPMVSPPKLAANVWFHSIRVGSWSRLKTLNFGTVRAIRALLNQLKPDVVHGQGSERFPAIAAAYSGFPNVVTLHGIMTQIARVEKVRPLTFIGLTSMVERVALRRTDLVLCLTHHASHVAKEFNEKVAVIPNAVSDRFFQIERKQSNEIEIIFPAHIYHLKNQHGVIEALDPLAAKIPLKLTLLGRLGNDAASAQVKKMVASRPWCRVAGFVDDAGMKEALSRAALLVLGSFEENCPMSILEGMAAGVPIAASRAGGIPDLVQDGVTGLLFDPRDLASIRGAVERMLTNRGFSREMAEAGRKRAEKEHRPKTIAARHLELYAKLRDGS